MTTALDVIAIRVVRKGKPISAFISELSHITQEELTDVPGPVSAAITDALQTSGAWLYDANSRIWTNINMFAPDATTEAPFDADALMTDNSGPTP